jgi:hypothetical protein
MASTISRALSVPIAGAVAKMTSAAMDLGRPCVLQFDRSRRIVHYHCDRRSPVPSLHAVVRGRHRALGMASHG